jgi:hypothetical protein
MDGILDRSFLQSGKSKNRHQPLGLMSPATTTQARGGRNNAHPAQLNPPFGWSWYRAAACDTLCSAGPTPLATNPAIACSSPRRDNPPDLTLANTPACHIRYRRGYDNPRPPALQKPEPRTPTR